MTQEKIARIAELQDKLLAKGGATKGKPLKGADDMEVEELRELCKEQENESGVVDEAAVEQETAPEVKEKKIVLAKPAMATKDTGRDIIAVERELRKYIKRAGGFRKDISVEAEREGKRLMKVLGRKKEEWDLSIPVDGIQ